MKSSEAADFFSLSCLACGATWLSEFVSDNCPQCGECSHYWELVKGNCDWCFGGQEHCSNCGVDVQHHDVWCPLQPEENRPEDYVLAGTINLKAWQMENRRQPFEIRSDHSGIQLAQSNRSGWWHAIWVAKDAPEESKEAARNLVIDSDTAFVLGKTN